MKKNLLISLLYKFKKFGIEDYEELLKRDEKVLVYLLYLNDEIFRFGVCFVLNNENDESCLEAIPLLNKISYIPEMKDTINESLMDFNNLKALVEFYKGNFAGRISKSSKHLNQRKRSVTNNNNILEAYCFSEIYTSDYSEEEKEFLILQMRAAKSDAAYSAIKDLILAKSLPNLGRSINLLTQKKWNTFNIKCALKVLINKRAIASKKNIEWAKAILESKYPYEIKRFMIYLEDSKTPISFLNKLSSRVVSILNLKLLDDYLIEFGVYGIAQDPNYNKIDELINVIKNMKEEDINVSGLNFSSGGR